MSKKLLFSVTKNDFEMQTFRCGGNGGQNVNKTSTGVRIIHQESGAVGESRSERSQYQNKKIAFRRLTESTKFKIWLNKKIFSLSIDEKEIERKVNTEMKKENLKIEGKENGKWMEIE
jgi:protein subunit release factor B